MKTETAVYVFDNDGTLYNCPSDFEKAVTEGMISCVAKMCSLSIERVRARRSELFRHYQVRSTLLVFYYEGVIKNVDGFVEETYLSVDPRLFGIDLTPELRRVLQDLESPLFIHTNNPSAFARKILDCLGITDLFQKIYGMFENQLFQKPDIRAFQELLKETSQSRLGWYIDNETPNLKVARQLGFKTIAVGEASREENINVDKRLPSVLELSSTYGAE